MGGAQTKVDVAQRKRVVVLGGGYGGTNVAKQLDPYFNVTLIDRQNYSTHSLGVLRAISNKSYLPSVVIPFDKLLKDGQILQGEIKNISDKAVVVQTKEGEQTIAFDFLVIATGVSMQYPNRPSAIDAQEAIKQLESGNDDVVNAKKVLIIGGGAVGVELAGEIKYLYPSKHVALVHGGSKLCADALMPKFYTTLEDKLNKLGVELYLNQRIELPVELQSKSYYKGKELSLKTSSGNTVSADVIFRCTGATPSTAHLQYFASKGALDAAGRLKVNEYLQVEGFSHIFAVGDCCNTAEQKQAYLAMKHAPIAAANLTAVASGRQPAKRYVPSVKQAMLLPVGPRDGLADLGGFMLPSFLVVMIKSKDLFTGNRWKELGYPGVGKDSPATSALSPATVGGAVLVLAVAAAVAANLTQS